MGYKSGMEPGEYENALVAAGNEIQELLKTRAEIDERINQLKRTMDALAALLTPSTSKRAAEGPSLDISDAGISDAIRQLLNEARTPLTPTEIRDKLMVRGVGLANYVNPLAVIHNTLKRLERQGELFCLADPVSQTVAYARVLDLPSDVAAAIYGGSATDSPENQPLPDRARVAGQIKAVKEREKK
jgi:hypothetical protein